LYGTPGKPYLPDHHPGSKFKWNAQCNKEKAEMANGGCKNEKRKVENGDNLKTPKKKARTNGVRNE
jgi:hypothetical protein